MYFNLILRQLTKFNIRPLAACKYFFISRSYEPIEFMLSDKDNLAYLVNSKVACSSLKQAILEKNNGPQVYTNYAQIHHEASSLDYCKKHIHNHEDYYIFTFVRNPFERIVSLYINKFLDKKKITEVGFEYENYLGGIFHQDMSFREFVSIISNVPEKISERHFKSQSYLIKQAPKVDYIGKLESMNNDYKMLSDKYSLPELPHSNKSPKYNYREFLNIESIEKIYKRYKNDIELFGYLNEYKELVNNSENNK
jgi:hypothetical protein